MSFFEEAITIFGNLVNHAASINFIDSDAPKTQEFLKRVRTNIRTIYGSESPYLSELNGVELYRRHAKSENREEYFDKDKALLIGVLNRILDNLKLSQYQDKQPPEPDSILIQPTFGNPLSWSENWADAFVLMPFDDTLLPVYQDHILKVTDRLGVTCKRGDDFFSDRRIMDEVWSAIYHADVCIADCTGRNANVFYEIGIAHTLGRKCILIAQSIDDIPFDLRDRRVIIYDFTPRGMDELEKNLVRTLENILSENLADDS